MPPWGRPPGARTGRNTWGRAGWDEARVEEVDSEDDVYGRELVRKGRYARELEYGGRGPRRRPVDYEDLTDDSETGEGGNFDLYDHEDSTVAYAVQLALRDKEDQLVDQALGRIRRAQTLGKTNVRLSKRELEALERKRQQVEDSNGSRRPKPPAKTSSRPSSRRSAAGFAPDQPPTAYSAFAPDPLSIWARGNTSGHSRPSSSSSAARPRTPTTQSLRPQQSNSPLRPTYSSYAPERFASSGRPQSMQPPPVYPRPLPDDPQWAPSYYNSMIQTGPYGETLPYQPQLPTDLRVGPQSRMSYPSAAPYPASPQGRRPSQSKTQSRGDAVPARAPAPAGAESEVSSGESESSDDDVQIVKVAKVADRPAQPVAVPQRKAVSGVTRGGARKRTSR